MPLSAGGAGGARPRHDHRQPGSCAGGGRRTSASASRSNLAHHQSITPDQSGSDPSCGMLIWPRLRCRRARRGRAPVRPPAPVRWNIISRLLAAQLGAFVRRARWSACVSPRAVGLDDADPAPVRAAPGEGDPLAVGAPFGRGVPAAAEADPPLRRCRRRSSRRAAAIRRGRFRRRSGCRRARSSGRCRCPGDVVSRCGSAAARSRRHRCRCSAPLIIEKTMRLPSGEKRGAKLIASPGSSGRCVARVDVEQPHLRPAAGVADVRRAAAPLGDRRGVSTIVSPGGHIAVVVAVAVHHRDALDPARRRRRSRRHRRCACRTCRARR